MTTGRFRDRLVQAAMHLFWAEGYRATTVSRVLELARANPGSLYHYFPTKEDLLIAVLDRYLERIGPDLLEPAWEGVDDPVERVFALLAQYRLGLEMTGLACGRPIGTLALEMSDPPAPVRERRSCRLGRRATWRRSTPLSPRSATTSTTCTRRRRRDPTPEGDGHDPTARVRPLGRCHAGAHPGPPYFAFLVDRDGRYRLYHRAGAEIHEIVPRGSTCTTCGWT